MLNTANKKLPQIQNSRPGFGETSAGKLSPKLALEMLRCMEAVFK